VKQATPQAYSKQNDEKEDMRNKHTRNVYPVQSNKDLL